jgi:hypothetical protein
MLYGTMGGIAVPPVSVEPHEVFSGDIAPAADEINVASRVIEPVLRAL